MSVKRSLGMIAGVGVVSLAVLVPVSDSFVVPLPRVQRINYAVGLPQKAFNSPSHRSLCQLAMKPRISLVSDIDLPTPKRVNNPKLIVVCNSIHMQTSR